jgi:zinc protease
MKQSTPLVLVLILALTAGMLSLRTRETPPPIPPVPSAPAPIPAAGQKASSTKTDTAVSQAAPLPWPHTGSDIAADSSAVFGSLANGMRYLIYPNAEPPGRISLRLHIAAGSLMETDDQRGLAHFLEHMVFNGTKNYSAADLIPRMQRLGIAFGAHANAYTSFDETVYMLDLPDMSADTLQLAYTVMRDFGDGALLELDEIDKERGVILSEKISRDSVNYRLMEQQFSKLLPDSLLTHRFPIGIESVIQNAPRERFLDFYTRFYTPQRMTFIVVGDVDVEQTRGRIEATFASMTNPSAPGANPDMGPIRQPEGLETAVFHDKEVAATDVSLMLVRPHTDQPDTRENRMADLPISIAHSIIDRRFERLSKEENSPIASGGASKSELFNYMELGSIDITAADDRWQETVPILEKEFRRALQHGFTLQELEEAKANILNAYEQAVKQKPTRKSDGIATVLARTINDNTVFSEPETDLEIIRAGLDTIDPATCHNAFRSFWDSSGFYLVLTTKEKPDKAEVELAALFEDSRGIPVDPPRTRAIPAFAYESFGTPGSIADKQTIEDLDITHIILSNRIRLNLKRTNFEKDRIHITSRIGSGKLSQPKDMPMLDAFADAVFNGGGLGKHSNDELQQILAGRNVGTSLGIIDDAFTLSGSTTPADFALQCRLMCAYLTDPGYRNEGLWQFQKAIPMIYQRLRHTPAGPAQEMESWLHGGDARYSLATEEKLAAYTVEDIRSWLDAPLAKGYLELSIVGDFDPDSILPEILATFGALPRRMSTPPAYPDERKVRFPNAPANKTFTYQSKIPQAMATVIWKTKGLRGNEREFRRLNLLGDIIGDRLRDEIREKLGASYSPNAGVTGSQALEGVGYFIAESVGKPEDLDTLLSTMRDLANELADQGATTDELDRALKPTLGILEKSLRDNSYWLNTVLADSQTNPNRLAMTRDRDSDYKSITLEEINTLAKTYLSAENALLVRIQPE